jgi:plastocyanin
MQRRIFTFIAIAALAAGLAACSSSKTSTTAASSAQISIDAGFKFTVAPVKAGDTVTVKNDSTATHTVTSDVAGKFNVTIDGGKTATFTAPAAGTYQFHCNIHNFMKGTLTVS